MIVAKIRRARLAATASAFPEHVWDREASARVVAELFPRVPRADRDLCVERAGVEERRLFVAPEHWGRREGHGASELAARAALDALGRSQLEPDVIDTLVIAADARSAPRELDSELTERLGLRRNVACLRIDACGASAGAAALALAAQLAEQGTFALLVVVACAPFEPGEGADALLAAVTLGHGAAAAVIAPDAAGWRIEASGSWSAPRAHELGAGRSAETRALFARHLPGALVRFLSEHERSLADVGVHAVHGSARAELERYAALFRVRDEALVASRRMLARHGDLGAATLVALLAVLTAERSACPLDVLAVAAGPRARLAFLLFERNAPLERE